MENKPFTTQPRRFALLIGASQYNDPALYPNTTTVDMQALANALRDPLIGGFHEVHLLLNETAVEIQLALAELLDDAKNPDDLLICYLSGQIVNEQDNLYLAVHDTYPYGRNYLNVSALDLDYIRRRSALCPARQLFIVDSSTAIPHIIPTLRELFSGPNHTLLSAITLLEPDTPPAPSAFTGWLAQTLQTGQADANNDGIVQLDELLPLITAQTPPEAVTYLTAPPTTPADWIIAGNPAQTAAPKAAVLHRSWAKWGILLLLLLAVGTAVIWAIRNQSPPINTAAAPPTVTITTPADPSTTPPVTAPATTQAAALATEPPAATAVSTSTIPPSETPTTASTATATSTTGPTNTPEPSPTPTATSEPLPFTVANEGAYLREGPATNFRILAILPQNTPLTAVARTDDGFWYNVVLADGRTGWLYNAMVTSTESPAAIPIAATIPAPENQFFDFAAVEEEGQWTLYVGHTYIGNQGDEAYLEATLLPGPTDVQTSYERGNELGGGLRIISFTRPATAEPAITTAVRLCMVSPTGDPFHCQEFPIYKQW